MYSKCISQCLPLNHQLVSNIMTQLKLLFLKLTVKSCHYVTGIAYLGGVCSAKRKCVLAEDNGLNLAFTIAHELGHK